MRTWRSCGTADYEPLAGPPQDVVAEHPVQQLALVLCERLPKVASQVES